MPLSITPPAITPPEITPLAIQPPLVQPPAVQPPAVQPPAVQPPAVQPPAVQPAAVVVTEAQMIDFLTGEGYIVISPTQSTSPSAVAWPFTLLITVPPQTAPAGKTIVGYSAVGDGSASFMQGQSNHNVFMVEGVGASWNGGAMTLTVSVHYSDGTTAVVGTTNSVTLPATSGTIIPTDPRVFSAGVFYWKGEFDFNEAPLIPGGYSTADYHYNDPAYPTPVICLTSSGQGCDHQPYAPVTSSAGYNLASYTHFNFTAKVVAGNSFVMYFEDYQDQPNGATVNCAQYATGPATPGEYCTYSVPLSAFGLAKLQVLKFCIAFTTAVAAGTQMLIADEHFS